VRKIENAPMPSVIQSSILISRSPPHKNLPIVINHQKNVPQSPPIGLNPPLQAMPQITPRAIQPQALPRLSQSHHFPQQFVHNPAFISSPKQAATMQSQISKAPKFTVEVVPGKVYPQKSSTIFKQSNASRPENSEKSVTLLLNGHKPTITTSEKVVA
jgi:hypothetical protein